MFHWEMDLENVCSAGRQPLNRFKGRGGGEGRRGPRVLPPWQLCLFLSMGEAIDGQPERPRSGRAHTEQGGWRRLG